MTPEQVLEEVARCATREDLARIQAEFQKEFKDLLKWWMLAHFASLAVLLAPLYVLLGYVAAHLK